MTSANVLFGGFDSRLLITKHQASQILRIIQNFSGCLRIPLNGVKDLLYFCRTAHGALPQMLTFSRGSIVSIRHKQNIC